MRKSEKRMDLRAFFRDSRDILRMIHRIRPAMLPCVFVSAVLSAAFPFVNIICGALILDRLLAGGGDVMVLVYWMVGLDLALGLGSKLLLWACKAEMLTTESLADAEVAGKCLTMDYQQLEDPEVMAQKTLADQGSNGTGGIFSFAENLSKLAAQLLTILYALVTVSRLFLPAPVSPDAAAWVRALNQPWAAALMIAVTLAVPLACLPLNRMASQALLELAQVNMDGNRRYGVFARIVWDYQVGKDFRTYRLERMFLDKFRQSTGKTHSGYWHYIRKEGALRALVAALNLLAVLAAYVFVGLKAMAGLITVGALSMQVGAVTALAGAIREAMAYLAELDMQRQYLKNYAAFLALPSAKYNGTLPVEKRSDGEFQLEFKDVSFRYPGAADWSLRHVSCRLPKAGRLAVVGPNGAGKTTFIKLLCRLYDPTEGEILLNGIDIRKYDYGEYLSILSVVFQDFRLFSMPLGENVAAGADADTARVWDCLERAGIRERVERLERGLDASLYQKEEGGVDLSGGEAQKVAIARALYKDAPLVILDEPTAALDPVSEYEIYSRFGEMVENRTSVYISHRMSSCRFCDLVYVFDGGAIVQQGSHEALLEDGAGLYAQLWQAQAEYYKDKE